MSIVQINVLSVPAEAAATLEGRFAARAGSMEGVEGFEGFDLLRPVTGTDRYLVVTRWASQSAFEAWRDGQAFAASHGGGRPSGEGAPAQRPAASDSELWGFEVVDLT